MILLVAFVIVGLISIARTGPTVDEPNHFTRGMAIWQTADTRLSFAHPPLANVLAAAPTAVLGELPAAAETKAWALADPGAVALELAEPDYGVFRRGLMRGRVVQLLWGLGLLLALYQFTRRHLGPLAGLVAIGTLGLNPTFVAHNALVTTDGPITFATFLLVTSAWDHGRQPDRWTALRFAAALALAPIVKLSGPILVVIGLAVFALARLTLPAEGWRARLARLGPITLHAVAAGVLVLLTINVAYGFDRTGLTVAEIREQPEPIHPLSVGKHGELVDREPLIARLPDQLRVPVPYTYVYGLAVVRTQTHRNAPTWFLGEKREGGHPAYVPVMLFAKSPVAWWILLGVVFVQALRRRKLPTATTLALVFTFAYALLASRSNAQLGVRYLLPCFPFLALAAASSFSDALAPRRREWMWAVASTAALGIVLAGGRNLGWFNLAVGGRAGGHEIAIIGEDWAQDLGTLAERAHELDAQPLYYESYHRFGPIELRHHGLEFKVFKCKTPDPGAIWIAVHRTRELRYTPECYPWHDRVVETHDIDHHLRLYRLRPAE